MRRAALHVSLASMVLLGACVGASGSPTASSPRSTTPVRGAATATAQDGLLSKLDIGAFPTTFPYRPYEWAPDGQQIAFIGSDRGLYIAAAPDYTPAQLDAGPASEPRWSPDGALIAFAQQDEGIKLISPSLRGRSRSVRVSPADDPWRSRVVQIYRWLDDRTIAYDVHRGTGAQQLYEMTVERPADGSPPTVAGTLHAIPFVRTCETCLEAALGFFYSPDGGYVVADCCGWPAVAWFDRQTGAQWIVGFPGDPPGATAGQTSLCREFVAWDGDSTGFVFKEAPPESNCDEDYDSWTFWHVDPRVRDRYQVTHVPQH